MPGPDLAAFDQTQALEEGWCIICSDNRGWEIQRDDRLEPIFPYDEDALAHVERCAAAGSSYHQRALDVLAWLTGEKEDRAPCAS